jgi:hypothetical protein
MTYTFFLRLVKTPIGEKGVALVAQIAALIGEQETVIYSPSS